MADLMGLSSVVPVCLPRHSSLHRRGSVSVSRALSVSVAMLFTVYVRMCMNSYFVEEFVIASVVIILKASLDAPSRSFKHSTVT